MAETETGAAGTETETGADESTSARLCSKPYRLSSTPGKGASTRAKADSPSSGSKSRKLAGGLEVAIGEAPRQAWTTKVGVEFDGLDPSQSHTIEIFDAKGKRLKSLKLDFVARKSEDLCLSRNDFYSTWQLRALRSGQRCGPCTTR